MQENTTFYDDTRYDNLSSLESKGASSPDKLSAKLAKLSALDKFKGNANKIKSELNNKNDAEVTVPETKDAAKVTPEVTPVEPTVESAPPVEEPKVEYPSKEVLESKTEGIDFYNGFEMPSAEALGRKLRVAPQVTNSMKYTLDTLGVDYTQKMKMSLNLMKMLLNLTKILLSPMKILLSLMKILMKQMNLMNNLLKMDRKNLKIQK